MTDHSHLFFIPTQNTLTDTSITLTTIMSSAPPPNDLTLYAYNASPYSRRLIWYLTLRRIPHGLCPQPPTLPRADLRRLGLHYRRIPLLAHGAHLHLDSRHVLAHLERAFPSTPTSPSLAPQDPTGRVICRLLDRYTTDAGIFSGAAGLIPPTAPAVKDAKFVEDRRELSGRDFSPAALARGRPEALVAVRDLFDVLEGMLADGRRWLLGTPGPSLADIEGVWIVEWLRSMDGALDPSVVGASTHPSVWGWCDRFIAAVGDAKKEGPWGVKIDGETAATNVLKCAERTAPLDVGVDEADPTGLRKGEEVTVWPTDSGFRGPNRDTGTLVGLSREEVVIRIMVEGRGLYVHAPRWGFKVVRASGEARL